MYLGYHRNVGELRFFPNIGTASTGGWRILNTYCTLCYISPRMNSNISEEHSDI